MRRTLIAALAVVTLAVIAAGCGGGDSTSQQDPTAAWASGFCSAVTAWTNDLGDVKSQFSDPSNLSQDGLESAAEDVRTATDTLVDDLKSLGAPETDSGQEVQSSIDTLSTTLDSEVSAIEDTVQGVTGFRDLPSAITKISASLSALGTTFSETLQTIQNADVNGELQAALQDSPECADISSS